MALLAVLIILVSAMLWSRITKGITAPMKEIQEAARQLCGGNLAVALNYQAKDELGDLADSMREMTTTLRQYFRSWIKDCMPSEMVEWKK